MFRAAAVFHANADGEQGLGIVRGGGVTSGVRGACEARDHGLACGLDGKNFGVFDDLRTGILRRAGQAGDDFAGIDCAAGDFFDDVEIAGVVPGDGRGFGGAGAAEFPSAGKDEAGIDVEGAEDFFVAGENVAEAGERSGSGFGKGHAAGAAAGAVADRFGFQDENGFAGGEFSEPRCGGKSCKASSDDGEIDFVRNGAFRGTKIDSPGRNAPGMRIVAHANWMQRLRLLCQGSEWRYLPIKP